MDEVSNGKNLQLASWEIIVGLAIGTRYFYIYTYLHYNFAFPNWYPSF